MKILYKGAGLTSQGIDFEDGKSYDVSDRVIKYLMETFPDNFSIDGKILNQKKGEINKPVEENNIVTDKETDTIDSKEVISSVKTQKVPD